MLEMSSLVEQKLTWTWLAQLTLFNSGFFSGQPQGLPGRIVGHLYRYRELATISG